ncbi:putative membrane protein [Halalkaliarchaeum sp. AArc-CO]|nr:putative membrane protein [Halalkaliarchaeum sp. AArc-CO]
MELLMVGPSLSKEERTAANVRLKIGFVGLVSASMGLMAFQLDPTPTQLLGALAGGAVAGTVLLWFLLRNLRAMRPG